MFGTISQSVADAGCFAGAAFGVRGALWSDGRWGGRLSSRVFRTSCASRAGTQAMCAPEVVSQCLDDNHAGDLGHRAWSTLTTPPRKTSSRWPSNRSRSTRQCRPTSRMPIPRANANEPGSADASPMRSRLGVSAWPTRPAKRSINAARGLGRRSNGIDLQVSRSKPAAIFCPPSACIRPAFPRARHRTRRHDA